MESKHKAGHLAEAHNPAEALMRRTPRIDPSKPLHDPLSWRDWLPAVVWIVGFVCFAIGGLKLGGIW